MGLSNLQEGSLLVFMSVFIIWRLQLYWLWLGFKIMVELEYNGMLCAPRFLCIITLVRYESYLKCPHFLYFLLLAVQLQMILSFLGLYSIRAFHINLIYAVPFVEFHLDFHHSCSASLFDSCVFKISLIPR
ncbi:unnamed protein product [Cuscuta epithymum]|uniref:Uncharacterized protein n=1 Tax=Cuscuta epithymum TaxID=186058 RepID=A0AAV0EJ23_9ASTE|nr:unnamed protein product [Cuscuta epithymum]